MIAKKGRYQVSLRAAAVLPVKHTYGVIEVYDELQVGLLVVSIFSNVENHLFYWDLLQKRQQAMTIKTTHTESNCHARRYMKFTHTHAHT